MYRKQDDIFPDETKEKKRIYKEELKREKEKAQQEKEAEKERRKEEEEAAEKRAAEEKANARREKRLEKERRKGEKRSRKAGGDVWAEPEADLDRIVTVADLPETLERKRVSARGIFLGLILGILILGSGFLAAYLAAFFNGAPFSLLGQWQLIVSTDIFMLSTAGFFSTEGRTEKIYGTFSIVSAACFVVELIITFS